MARYLVIYEDRERKVPAIVTDPETHLQSAVYAKESCKRCWGTGVLGVMEGCATCLGTGTLTRTVADDVPCAVCDGTGKTKIARRGFRRLCGCLRLEREVQELVQARAVI